MTKVRKRNKNLNDALLSRSCGKHSPKTGRHISRARRKHNQNKGDIDG
jgi:hypothetical protein